jgi:hypothetical protein
MKVVMKIDQLVGNMLMWDVIWNQAKAAVEVDCGEE